jgi:hypothetical protein
VAVVSSQPWCDAPIEAVNGQGTPMACYLAQPCRLC